MMGEFALEGVLILVETALMFAAGIGGLVASIVIGLAKDNFAGDCLLYSQVKWCNQTTFYFTSLGSNPACSFCIGLQVVISFYALGYGCYHVSVLCTWVKEIRAIILPSIIINAVITFLVFIQACVLSVGFKRFCDGFTGGAGKVKSCNYQGSLDWNSKASKCVNYVDHGNYSGEKFYEFYTTAQGSCWFCLLFWFVATILIIIRRVTDKPIVDPNSDKANIISNVAI